MVSISPPASANHPHYVRHIAHDRPWHWLALGWRDMMNAPVISLVYGAGLVLVSYLLVLGLWQADLPYLVLPMAAGFFLIAPLIAVGLYDTSRRLEQREPTGLLTALTAWRRPVQIAAFGVVLLLLHFAWTRVALLWFALYFHGGTPPLEAMPFYLLEAQNLPFLVIGTLLGGAFAVLVFAVSAVSLPMLLDRDVDVISAIITSVRSVQQNPRAMALWAGLIVLCTAVGLVTFFVGLGVLFPLVAHASWHAYRDLVR
ncbi:DUF2189 domain-containing protein [uncultured Ferrovibrio sp.]|mgnify:CR=1 FL=1|uniref:DUF2189 domain-containing protein n=1 Tax=uncultured Ferrovibrio sp. TaxID=1576913 RepID=UPI002632DC0B|nr:DUF2189 domain-containing protein [uncultured Ferrovibrio sp.]